MADIKRIQEIKDEIKQTSEVGLRFFEKEFALFHEKLAKLTRALNEELVKVKKEMAVALADLEKIYEDTKAVKKEYTIFKRKLGDLNQKSKENTEKEEELLKLHKILVNKGKSLKAKEVDLNERARRLDDR